MLDLNSFFLKLHYTVSIWTPYATQRVEFKFLYIDMHIMYGVSCIVYIIPISIFPTYCQFSIPSFFSC